MADDYKRRINEAREAGGNPAAAGAVARELTGRMVGGALSAAGAVKSSVWDPAANALRTAVTGDPTPIPGTSSARSAEARAGGAPAPATTPPRAGTTSPTAPPAATAGESNERMSAMGWSNRGVDGAKGVTRYDKAGSSPLYSNAPGNTADWVSGGMKPGVNTVPASSFSAPARGGASAQRTAAMDNQSFMSGNTLSRPGTGGGTGGGIGGGVTSRHSRGNTWGLSFARKSEDRAADREQRERFDTSAMERARMSDDNQLSRQQLANDGAMNVEEKRSAQRGAQARMRSTMDTYQKIMSDPDQGMEAANAWLEAQLGPEDDDDEQTPTEYYEGGLVDSPYDSAIGYAQGGMVGGAGYGQTPQAENVLPEINEYREYAMGAKSLGVPAVPFEQFLTMRAGAKQTAGAEQSQGAMAFAAGGEVPDPRDVSGRMVMDTDPNAPTDSIPAVVDEQMPAKLDSGEFVIPTDVVQFFGTDKLNKMIAQARQGQQG